MPYRIDIYTPPPDALDTLIELEALDVETVSGGLAAILPDAATPDTVIRAIGTSDIRVSAAVGRDNGSVWLVSPRRLRAGGIDIAPPGAAATPGTLLLADSDAFGTGHHPTTALCLETIEEFIAAEHPRTMLDVGIGSGILALAALLLGVEEATGVDIDPAALEAAAANARLNGLEQRLRLVEGGPEAVDGVWPLVVANVLAAPLIEMAPMLVRRLASRGRLVLAGIHCTLEGDVLAAYRHYGVRHVTSETRGGWTTVIVQASW